MEQTRIMIQHLMLVLLDAHYFRFEKTCTLTKQTF